MTDMNTTTSKIIFCISVSLITLGLMLVTAAVTRGQTSSEFTVPLTDPAKRAAIKAHINFGSITVKGTGRKDVLVKYVSVADDEHDEGDREHSDSRAGLKRVGGGGIDLEVTENNNQVNIQSNSWQHRINLEIEIPTHADLQLHTYNGGDLMVTNVQGELALTNFNGEVTALNIAGSVVASTYNGEIKVSFDKVTPDTPMSFSTFNGDIDLTFPSTTKATLKMKTEQGELFTGFEDVNMISSGPVQKKDTKAGVYKVVVDDWKRAEINGGGAEITMKNYNGDILVRKK